MKIPKQILIDGKVIQENDVYDFSWWFYAICTGEEYFERFSREFASLRDSIKKIQGEILKAIEALFSKGVAEEELTVNFPRDRLHEFFFVNSFSTVHLENVSLFSSTMRKTQELAADWEKLFFKCEEEIA